MRRGPADHSTPDHIAALVRGLVDAKCWGVVSVRLKGREGIVQITVQRDYLPDEVAGAAEAATLMTVRP